MRRHCIRRTRIKSVCAEGCKSEGLGLRITCILFHAETKHALDHNIDIILAANIIPQHCTLLVLPVTTHLPTTRKWQMELREKQTMQCGKKGKDAMMQEGEIRKLRAYFAPFLSRRVSSPRELNHVASKGGGVGVGQKIPLTLARWHVGSCHVVNCTHSSSNFTRLRPSFHYHEKRWTLRNVTDRICY